MKLSKKEQAIWDMASVLKFMPLGDMKDVAKLSILWGRESEEHDFPAIYIAKERKGWSCHVNAASCSWTTYIWFVVQKEAMRFGVCPEIRRGPTHQSATAYGLTEVEAQSLAQNLVDAFWYQKTNRKERNMVKFFKDGKALALQTDATDEAEFTRDFSVALQDYMISPKSGGLHEIETWLHGYAEICCKIRGYKADVQEQRLLTVGVINPASETCVNITEHGTALRAVA